MISSLVPARELYEQGRLVEAARKEADACDRDGYYITASILRDLADKVEGFYPEPPRNSGEADAVHGPTALRTHQDNTLERSTTGPDARP